MSIIQLTSSRFFGGPERQILGLANAMASRFETHIVSFSEGGLCQPFLEEATRRGISATQLQHDTPHLWRAACELVDLIRAHSAEAVFCGGYKANLIGLIAGLRAGIPAVAVSRGWTGESRRVRVYEKLDRTIHRWMHHVVCVSQGQANKVLKAGVPSQRVSVIHNAIEPSRFSNLPPDSSVWREFFDDNEVSQVVMAAGRLSPEKGFDVLIRAANQVCSRRADTGFVLFGDGVLGPALQRQIEEQGLSGRFVLAGFCSDLDDWYPKASLLAQASYTEGLPNVILEAMAARRPVVATDVGGTAELVENGVTGTLVPAGNADQLAKAILEMIAQPQRSTTMGERGRERVVRDFSFQKQAQEYERLLQQLHDARYPQTHAAAGHIAAP